MAWLDVEDGLLTLSAGLPVRALMPEETAALAWSTTDWRVEVASLFPDMIAEVVQKVLRRVIRS